MDNIDWTIVAAEQGHRHASGIARAHEGYVQETMQARSQLGQVSALWPRDEKASEEAALLRKLHRLQHRRPSNYQGRQEFCRGLLDLAQQKKHAGLVRNPRIGQRIIARHKAEWDKLSYPVKRAWEARASENRAAKARKIQAEAEGLQHQLTLRASASSEGSSGSKPPCRLSMCRFTQSEVVAFDSFWDGPRYTQAAVQIRREAVVQSVGPPDEGVRLRLDAFRETQESTARQPPHWLRTVALNRLEFTSALFEIGGGDGGAARFFFIVFSSRGSALRFWSLLLK